MNEFQLFNNEELKLKVRAIQNEDGSISINAEDTARGFGWTTVAKSGNEVVRWARMNEYCKEIGFSQQVGKDDYIPESLFYRLGMKANNAVADKFQNWLAMEVIPSIRKTGHYGKPMTIPEQIQLLAKGNVELSEKIEQVDKRIDTLEQDMPLYGCEIEEVKSHINRKGVEVLGGKQSEAYHDASIRGSVYSDMYRQLKREYGAVSSYKSIKRKYIADVHDFIDCYTLPRILEEQIIDANGQMSFGR